MRSLVIGILLVVAVGVAGFVYRHSVEYPRTPSSCPLDTKVCPDGSNLGRSGSACGFASCPPPNAESAEAGIAFVVPKGYLPAEATDASIVSAYRHQEASSTIASSSIPSTASILIRRFLIMASSTASSTIRETAISGASGGPVSASAFATVTIGGRRFTLVPIERFEGTVDTAYYLSRENDVLRFDAVDTGVARWTDSSLDPATLPAAVALRQLLVRMKDGPMP